MIYFLLGKDFSIINKRVEELIKSLKISNIIKFEYTESSVSEILTEVNYVDLFNEKKLIVVSSFDVKSLEEEDEKLLTKYINNMNDNVIIFKCVNESFDERRSFTKLIREKCKVEIIEKLDYKTLHEYISNMFKNAGINASFNQIKKILDLCEYNPDYTINEVEKLLIYKINEKELFDKDIDDVISKNNEKEMFTFIDGLMTRNINEALTSYKILLSSDYDPAVIIDNIAKQFRALLRIKKLIEKRKSEKEISRLIGVNEYVVHKYSAYINSFSDEDILDILYRLSELDINIKIQGMDSSSALESFIISF